MPVFSINSEMLIGCKPNSIYTKEKSFSSKFSWDVIFEALFFSSICNSSSISFADVNTPAPTFKSLLQPPLKASPTLPGSA